MKQTWQWTVVFITGIRMFLQAILLEREAYNACWLAPVLGFLIALPFVWIASGHMKRRSVSDIPDTSAGRLLHILALAYFIADTAQIVLLYQEGTKFASLSSYPSAVLYLLLLIFSLFVVRQNRNGLFGAGTAAKSMLLLGLSALLIFRIPELSILRLSPVLGNRVSSLFPAGLSLSGYGFCFLYWLSHAPDFQPEPKSVIGMWALSCGSAALYAAVEVMLSPISPGEPNGLYLSVGRLLASGRMQTSLQLILYLIWFSLMFLSVCLNVKCMARALSRVVRRDEGWAIQIAVLLSSMILAILCEHMMGENLEAFLDIPGAFRACLLPALLLICRDKQPGKAVSA